MTEAQSRRFFEIYYKCRFQALIAFELMNRYKSLQELVLWSMLITVCGSLIVGSAAFSGVGDLRLYWGLLTIAGTGISIYNVAKSPSDRRFSHFEVERVFSGLALECENFTRFAVHEAQLGLDINKVATDLHARYTKLMERTGIEHREYGNENSDKIQARLNKILQAEGMIKDGSAQYDNGTGTTTT